MTEDNYVMAMRAGSVPFDPFFDAMVRVGRIAMNGVDNLETLADQCPWCVLDKRDARLNPGATVESLMLAAYLFAVKQQWIVHH